MVNAWEDALKVRKEFGTFRDEDSLTSEESQNNTDEDDLTATSSSTVSSSSISVSSPQSSVLIVGATGRAGTEMVRHLAGLKENDSVAIFGMSPDIRMIPRAAMAVHLKYTEELIQGDATKATDLPT